MTATPSPCHVLLVMTLLFSSLTSFAEITNNKEIRRNLLNEKLAVEVLERFNNGKEKIEVLVKLKEQADVESISNKATLELNSLRLDDYNIRLGIREDVVEAWVNCCYQGFFLIYLQL